MEATLLVIMGIEFSGSPDVNRKATAIVLENLFYGPSSCPGLEEDPFIYQKAWSMINGRNVCNSDQKKKKRPQQISVKCFPRKGERN